MTSTVVLFDPTAPPQTGSRQARHALAGLAGLTVGFIDNAKPNFNHLVDDLADVLAYRYGIAGVMKRRKTSASVPAPEVMVEELASRCDLVITGSGD